METQANRVLILKWIFCNFLIGCASTLTKYKLLLFLSILFIYLINNDPVQAKEEHYNHLRADIEELDKHHNPIMYSKVKSMEHNTKIKLGIQNKDGELLTEPAHILDRWF